MMNTTNEKFQQLVIEDPNCLSGVGISNFIIPLIEQLSIRWVLTRDVIGAGVPAQLSHDGWLTAEEFKLHIGTPTQFDWGFFFMFSEASSSNLPALEFANDRSLIEKAKITARLSDSHEIFLYWRMPLAHLDEIGMSQKVNEKKNL